MCPGNYFKYFQFFTVSMFRLICKQGIRYGAIGFSRRQTGASRSFSFTTPVFQAAGGVPGAPKSQDQDLPWYLRETEPLEEHEMIGVGAEPELPAEAPEDLKTLVRQMRTKGGLADIVVMDMTKLPVEEKRGANEVADYMVICTTKSGKHAQKAAAYLYTFLKSEFGVVPTVEGLVKESKKVQRNRLKKVVAQKLSGVDGYYGDASLEPNSWVMLDTKVQRVAVHLLTDARRQELNLEYLFAPKLEKEKYRKQDRLETSSDDIFSGIRYFHTGTPRSTGHQVLDDAIKYVNGLLVEEAKGLFQRDVKISLPFSARDILRFENDKAVELMSLVLSSVSFEAQYFEKLYQLYVILFQVGVADANCLKEVVYSRAEEIQLADINNLADVFMMSYHGTSLSKEAFLENSRKYLDVISELLSRYSFLHGEADFQSPEMEALILKLVDLASYNGVVNPQLRFIEGLILGVANNMEANFKNEYMFKLVSVYVSGRRWDDVWRVWKDPQVGLTLDNAAYVDSRPWGAFLKLVRSTENTELMRNVVNYWEMVFERNHLVVDEEVRAGIVGLLENFSKETFPIARKMVK